MAAIRIAAAIAATPFVLAGLVIAGIVGTLSYCMYLVWLLGNQIDQA